MKLMARRKTKLVLSAKVGESIRVGKDVDVTVEEVQPNKAKLSFKAPKNVDITRHNAKKGKDGEQLEMNIK